MVQDFTQAGIQPTEPPNPLTGAVRTGLPVATGWAGVARGIDKLIGAVPPGIDAPTLALRQTIAGGWALLAVLKHGLGAFVFGLLGLGCVYLRLRGHGDVVLLGVGLASLALAALLARWAWQALRALRAIGKA